MEYLEALQLLKDFKKDGQEISPALTDDWEYYFEGDNLFFKSENLNLGGRFLPLIKFTRDYLLGDEYVFEGNKLIGNYAITRKGFITEEKFNKATTIANTTVIDEYKRKEMTSGFIYKTLKGDRYFYFYGNLKETAMFSFFEVLHKDYLYQSGNSWLIKVNEDNEPISDMTVFGSHHQFIEEEYPSNDEYQRLLKVILRGLSNRAIILEDKTLENSISLYEYKNGGLFKYKDDFYIEYPHIPNDKDIIYLSEEGRSYYTMNLVKVKSVTKLISKETFSDKELFETNKIYRINKTYLRDGFVKRYIFTNIFD